jgi:hypothetical protein
VTVDPQTLQLNDRVVPTGRYLYADLVCTVVAIQRRRFRAKVRWPDGHERWIPTKELRQA